MNKYLVSYRIFCDSRYLIDLETEIIADSEEDAMDRLIDNIHLEYYEELEVYSAELI